MSARVGQRFDGRYRRSAIDLVLHVLRQRLRPLIDRRDEVAIGLALVSGVVTAVFATTGVWLRLASAGGDCATVHRLLFVVSQLVSFGPSVFWATWLGALAVARRRSLVAVIAVPIAVAWWLVEFDLVCVSGPDYLKCLSPADGCVW